MTYDLILKGGHVLDPGLSIDQTMGIAIADGRIAEIGSELSADAAKAVI